MKTKNIVMIALAAVISASVLWLAPHCSLAADKALSGHKILYYTCPMHPSVKAGKPGDCSICGMTLQPVCEKTKGTNAPPPAANTNPPAAMRPGCCSAGGCR